MNPNDFPSNEDDGKATEEAWQHKPSVVSKPAKMVKKETPMKRFWNKLFRQDLDDLSKYAKENLADIALRAIGDWLINVIEEATGSRNGRRSNVRNDISYTNRYNSGSYRANPGVPVNGVNTSSYSQASSGGSGRFDEISLYTRDDAEKVLNNMINAINEYGQVSVADMKEFAGMSAAYTENSYGWKGNMLGSADVRRTRNGYTLILPRAIPLVDR